MPINERRRDDITAAVAAYDSANRRRGYRAPPHGCWPSCFPLRMCANKARRRLSLKGSAVAASLRFCNVWSRPGSCPGTRVRALCLTPIVCTCRRCGHEMPPPREGLRPGPRGAAGSQRQSPRCGLRPQRVSQIMLALWAADRISDR